MRRHATSLLAAAALAAAVLAPGSARAQAADQGKMLFNAGAQAYEAGQFPAAIQAFEQAYRLSARPGILFSLAQAHRKQYYVARQPDDLRAAMKGYRDYLAQVAQGGRRSDAAEALAELEPLASKLEAAGVPPPAAPAQAAPVTRLMVSSQTAGALVSLDGGKPAEAPLFAEIAPGKHSVHVTAPGFVDETHELDAPVGGVSPLDVRLKEKPGRLSIDALAQAQVTLDGRFVASTPLAQPLDVEPGHHLLAVTRNGYRAYVHEIEIGRDEAKTLDVKLETTTQRTVSYVLFGTGAAAVVVGGVLAALALQQESQAQAFVVMQNNGTARCPSASSSGCAAYVQSAYTGYLDARNAYRLDAGVALGAAVLLGGTGVALFALDQPTLDAARRDDAPRPAAPSPRERPLDSAATPLLGPGLYGAALHGHF